MRVLVTGGAGYIGSHLVDRLLTEGHEVSILDNLSTGKIQNIEHCLDRVRFTNGSILDEALVESEVARAELVFHLAAAVGVHHIVNAPLEGLITNSRGTENVLAACFKHWRRIMVASTSEVYGKTPKVPMSEDDDRVLGPTKIHRWGYSTAKALDEHLALAYHAHGLPVSIVRYFNSFGPRIDPRGYGSVVAHFISQALAGDVITVHGDGQQSRSFTFVDDTVAGTYLVGTEPDAIGRIYNIGNPHETTIIELAETIRAAVGSSSDIVTTSYESYYGAGFEDTRRRVPDVSRAHKELGWQPLVSLEDGLERTFQWWKATYGG